MIINADGFGYSQNVNEAIKEAFKRGLINRTTIMVNMPHADNAAKVAKEGGFFSCVGLHINLTEGRALSERCAKSSLCDENGFFKGSFHIPFKSRIYLNKEIRNAISAECEAQIKKFLDMGFSLMHIDSHNCIHTYISVFLSIKRLMKKYGFYSMRISRNLPENDFSLPFRVYNGLFNRYINHLKVGEKRLSLTKYFCSAKDYEKLEAPLLYKNEVELMTHPIIKDGALYDNELSHPHPFIDEKWLSDNQIDLEDTSGRKKKLLVCFIQAHIGGAQTSLVNFLNALDLDTYDVDLIFYENENERYGIKEGINILPQGKTHTTFALKNIFTKALNPIYLVAKMRATYCRKIEKNKKKAVQIMAKVGCRYSFDISKSYDAAIAYESSWALNYVIYRVKAKKKILWMHNDFNNAGLSFKVDEKSFKKADALCFVSEGVRESFVKKYKDYDKKAYYIPNLLTSSFVRERGNAEEVSMPFEGDNLTFITVARVNFAAKALDRALRVFKRLKDDNLLEKVKWVIIGKGPEFDAMKALISKEQLEDTIFLLGVKKNPIPYMKKSDILFLPSKHEGTPMVVTEGFIMGLVPVVTNYTSAKEQIKNEFDGLIFENSEEGLYEGLKALLKNTDKLIPMAENVKNGEYGNEKEIKAFYDMMNNLFEK